MTKSKDLQREWMARSEVATFLGVTVKTLENWEKAVDENDEPDPYGPRCWEANRRGDRHYNRAEVEQWKREHS